VTFIVGRNLPADPKLGLPHGCFTVEFTQQPKPEKRRFTHEPSLSASDLLQLAGHESGHGVIDELHDIPVSRIVLRADGSGETVPADRPISEGSIAGMLAGKTADLVLQGTWDIDACASDVTNAYAMATRLYGAKRADAEVIRINEMVNREVREHLPAIRALRDALYEGRRLIGADVRAIIARYL
jgi:hypothetical protein